MKSVIAALVVLSMAAGTAMAQTATASPAAPAATTTAPAKAPVVRSAKSLDCSKRANAKALHGKPRKHFMSACKKA